MLWTGNEDKKCYEQEENRNSRAALELVMLAAEEEHRKGTGTIT